MPRVRPVYAAVPFVLALLFAPSTYAVVLDYQGFVVPSTANMGSGPDLLVGTSDDTAAAGFNTGGDLAHNFFFDDAMVTGASAFTSDSTYNDASVLGFAGTSTSFTNDGQSVDSTGGSFPFFYRDDPTVSPHSFEIAAGGRNISYEYTIETCAQTDPTCTAPTTVIDSAGDGLLMLPGDNPTAIYNASTIKPFFDFRAPTANVPAYLTFLASIAPQGWAAISVTTSAVTISSGNCTGSLCATFDGDTLIGVVPTYTLPEPTSGAAVFAVFGVLATLARRQTRRA